MTSTSMNIIEYLNANAIMWEPIDFDIIDGKKKPQKYCINYMPKSTDFAELSDEVIEQRQKLLVLLIISQLIPVNFIK